MKLRWGAYALALAAANSHAQSNVTVYGIMDQYLGYMRSAGGNSILGMNDGALLRSRIGFRGTEELGGGMQATFTLENGLFANDGTAADSSRLFDRQAWVGLRRSDLGELRLGRQNTEIFFIGETIDHTGRTSFASIINVVGVPSRYDNDISYTSPRMAGVKLTVHYALRESTTQSARQDGVMQLAVDYTAAPWRVGYAGLGAKPARNAPIGNAVQYHNLYADWDYGRGKVYFSFLRTNNVTANAAGNTAASILSNVGNNNNSFAGNDPNVRRFFHVYQMSADYWVTPALRLGALAGTILDTSGGGAGAHGGNVGAYYSLSKRTTLYGFGNWMKNQTNGGFRFSGSGAPSAALSGADINGRFITGWQLGILHKF